jgi:hypothetical protein
MARVGPARNRLKNTVGLQRNMSFYHKLMSKVIAWVCEKCLVGEHAGIKLSDINFNESDNALFVEKTTQALDLINNFDPRRFARVKCHIDYIINIELHSGGQYGPARICQLDFGRWDFAQHSEWSLYMYAATIVHEATHGHIRAKGIRRTRQNRMQVERICQAEENRFLSRIESSWGDRLQRPFDPKVWNFGSRLDRIRELLRRIMEEKRKA